MNIIAPPRCPVSGRPVGVTGDLDPEIWGTLQFVDDPVCRRCGAPFAADYGADVECPSCIAEPPRFNRARAALVFDDCSAPMIHGFKFGDRTELAVSFGRWMARAGAALINDQTIIAPVPLHWTRLAARRFNQAALLAQAVASRRGAWLDERLLERTRATPPQRDTVSVDARRRNVAGAFRVSAEWRDRIQGAQVLLVDDVLTSGATLSACAGALQRAGAAQVDVLVLARVVKGGGAAL